jgi:hypothetical protein
VGVSDQEVDVRDEGRYSCGAGRGGLEEENGVGRDSATTKVSRLADILER